MASFYSSILQDVMHLDVDHSVAGQTVTAANFTAVQCCNEHDELLLDLKLCPGNEHWQHVAGTLSLSCDSKQ